MEFLKELGIQENDSLTINNEKGSVKRVLNSCMWIESYPTDSESLKEYCIENIGQLLMVNPVFEKKEIQEKVEAIKAKDKETMKNRESLSGVLGNDLIGEGKPYLLQDGLIWYSFEKPESEDSKIIRPSATPITDDALGFEPINEVFSKDSKNAYYQYYKICNNIADIKPLRDSNYCYDGQNVIHRYNPLQGAHIEDGQFTIISNDKIEILRDSENNRFARHRKAEIKHPEQCQHVVDNFLFDGENIYIVIGSTVYNLTEIYGLTPGNNVSKISENTYKVGEKTFTYDGMMELEGL